MDNTTAVFLIAAIVVFIATIGWYEHQLVHVTARLDELLDNLDELNDLASDPPFNLSTWHPTPQPKLALVSDQVFSSAEIEGWN